MMRCLFTLMLLCVSLSLHAAPSLTDIKEEIQVIKTDLKKQKTSQTKLQKQLKNSEETLSKLKAQHEITQQHLKQQAAQLTALKKDRDTQEKTFSLQQEEMSNQIRMAYILQEDGGFLKILLNQKDIANAQKNLTYHQFILKQRAELIAQLRNTVHALEKNAQAMEEKRKTLLQLQLKQQLEIGKIQDVQLQRAQILEDIDTSIASNAERLAVLEKDRKALEAVLQKLKQPAATSASLTTGKRKAPLPAQGKIVTQPKQHSILITATQGAPVHAISSGRVVFAQWMQGYGLLVIVDHKNGYMSLYGRNDVVYRKVGDEVSAGDVLSTIGKSGGYHTPALYFAVRKAGKAVDPCLIVQCNP